MSEPTCPTCGHSKATFDPLTKRCFALKIVAYTTVRHRCNCACVFPEPVPQTNAPLRHTFVPFEGQPEVCGVIISNYAPYICDQPASHRVHLSDDVVDERPVPLETAMSEKEIERGCPICGADLRHCPDCKTPYADGSGYCTSCGTFTGPSDLALRRVDLSPATPEVSEARLRNQAENIVGTVFDNTEASHETLKRVMVKRITAALLVAYRSATPAAHVDEKRMNWIRLTRATGVLPWDHISSPTQERSAAGNTIDYLLTAYDELRAQLANVRSAAIDEAIVAVKGVPAVYQVEDFEEGKQGYQVKSEIIAALEALKRDMCHGAALLTDAEVDTFLAEPIEPDPEQGKRVEQLFRRKMTDKADWEAK